jgi:bacterioferritin
MTNPFQLDLSEIRRRAREHMSRGAVTDAYKADRQRVIEVLNQALATELVCVLRYKNHYYTARGIRGQTCAAEFLQHAGEEQQHADLIAERIAQLGGIPNLNPDGLATRSHSEYREGESLRQMLGEDLVAERVAIETYSAIVRWLGDDDPTSRRLMETLLAKEEEHADDLSRLLQDFT